MDPTFLIIIAVFALMMWMMSRGAKKQRNAAAELRSSLQEGQQVMTAAGFYGTIVDIDGDVITLESSPGIETMWKREAITAVTEPPFAAVDDETTSEDDVAALAVPDDASALTAENSPAEVDRPVIEHPADDDTDDERRA